MKTFRIRYYYNASGMEGIADTMPERDIQAVDKDHAVYQYSRIAYGLTFDQFMREPQYIREWGLTIKEL